MVTLLSICVWFIASSVVFMLLTFLPWLEKAMDDKRSVNTAVVLLSQGIGAGLAYALS